MKKIKLLIVTLSVALSITVGHTQTQIPLPAQTGTFSGNVRGYWFTAPDCFTITGLEVPTDASSGNQSIALLRFPTNPPVYSTTTNVFDVLFLVQNDANPGAYSVNIPINQGDVIGVLGYRGTTNSYAGGTYASTINGLPITLERLGMQYSLATTAPQQVWTEVGGSISRTFIYYDSTLVYNLTYSAVGTSVTFDNTTDTAYTNFTEIWDYGDGSPLDTAHTPTHVYPGDGSYNVCNYIISTCQIDTICTTVNICSSIPSAGYTSSVVGANATFTDGSANATSWFWDFGDGNTDTVQNPVHSYTANGTYTVCQIASTPCDADTICDTVNICVPPTAAFTFSSISTDSVSFTDATSFPGTVWAWDFGDGNVDSTQTPVHAYTSSGTYLVCLTISGPCGTDIFCDSVFICLESPVAGFSSSSVELDASFTNNSNYTSSYLWDFGDGNTSTSMSPMHTYASSGTYYVCLTSYNDCGGSNIFCDSVTVVSTIGLENINESLSINIYPNPSNGNTSIPLQITSNQVGELYIASMTGKKIKVIYAGEFNVGQQVYQMNTSEWAKGAYLVICETNLGKQSRMLIVQ